MLAVAAVAVWLAAGNIVAGNIVARVGCSHVLVRCGTEEEPNAQQSGIPVMTINTQSN